MHALHPSYVIAPEVTNEFNLLNDFLQTSLLDDNALVSEDQNQAGSASGFGSGSNNNSSNVMIPSGAVPGNSLLAPGNADQGKAISRPGSTMPTDKTREYYLQAADPSGNASPEERMRQVLQAKYEAGLLRPFNYVKGYTRLQNYLDTHMAPASKQKVLRQLDRFRPKFREKMKDLVDMDLILVEMWFEKTLMDYDRVFASMAVPACCWRRTGEIFRGNKEMAELIRVPVEDLRGVSNQTQHIKRLGCCVFNVLTVDDTTGQDLVTRDPHGGVCREILGGVWHDRLRPAARHAAHGLLTQEPGRLGEPRCELLLLV